MLRIIRDFAQDESGATAIEYGLIVALVSIAGITALDTMGGDLVSVFDEVSSTLDKTANG